MDNDVPIDEVRLDGELDPSLLPIFQKYKQENSDWINNFDFWDYLNLRADYDLAAAFTKLFWPDFVEVDGCVLLKRNYSPENFSSWMEHFNGDRREVEAMINHEHIWDRFMNSPKDVDYPAELYEYLAQALMFGWKQALQQAFPSKRFAFTIRHGHGPELSFHQVEERSSSEK